MPRVRHLLLLAEGDIGDCDLVVDGIEVEAESLPVFEGLRRVMDSDGTSYEVSGECSALRRAPPADYFEATKRHPVPLAGSPGSAGRRGCWVQLLPPESSEADEFLDHARSLLRRRCE